jgi:hypothetical protein
MSFLRTLKKLVLGETWILPLGIATALSVTALATSAWPRSGALILTAGVILTLLASVSRGARR